MMKKNQGNPASLLVLLLVSALVCFTAACSRPEPGKIEEPEYKSLSMGTGTENGTWHMAGAAVASVIGNTVPRTYVEIEFSKGSPINAKNVNEGKLDLALVSGDTAYDAFYGVRSLEREKMEHLRALGACYPLMSGWIAGKKTGLAFVHELEGRTISTGAAASRTDTASRAALTAMGIDEENTIWEPYEISDGLDGIRDGWADAAHEFSIVPSAAQRSLAEEMETMVLAYTEEEVDEILRENPFYYRAWIPAGTYRGQEEEVLTFGVKVLLCASEEMEEELAYQIAMALDVNGAVYTGGHEFMAPMQDKEFLSKDLPIPLHEGAERYYREKGYID